jgi:urease accessory protein
MQLDATLYHPRSLNSGTSDLEQRLSMLRLGSAALPIGAFAYSQGLETAVARGKIHNLAATVDWLKGLLENALLSSDVPLLARLHRAWTGFDVPQLNYWNHQWRAMRATRELRDEDRQLGASLLRLLARQGIEPTDTRAITGQPTLGLAMSLAAVSWGLDPLALGATYCFAWVEAQVGAAVRLVPLGQTEAQTAIAFLLPAIATGLTGSLSLEDDEITSTVPGQTLCSALHETLYTRLFRS